MAITSNDRNAAPLEAEAQAIRQQPATTDGEGNASELELDRERQPGLGYGRSNGYGTRLHFEDGHVDPMFRSHW